MKSITHNTNQNNQKCITTIEGIFSFRKMKIYDNNNGSYEQFTNTFSSDYWEQSMGPTAHVFGSFRDLLAKRRNTTDEPHEVDGF